MISPMPKEKLSSKNKKSIKENKPKNNVIKNLRMYVFLSFKCVYVVIISAKSPKMCFSVIP